MSVWYKIRLTSWLRGAFCPARGAMRSTVTHVGNLRTENIIQMLQRRWRRAANGVCEKKACLVCWSEEGKQLLDYMLLLHYVMSLLEIFSSFSG